MQVSVLVSKMKIGVSQVTSTDKTLFSCQDVLLGCILNMHRRRCEGLPALPAFSPALAVTPQRAGQTDPIVGQNKDTASSE